MLVQNFMANRMVFLDFPSTDLAISGGKRQFPPLMPPKINHWRRKIADDNFTNICVNKCFTCQFVYFFKYEHMITILLICSLLDVK